MPTPGWEKFLVFFFGKKFLHKLKECSCMSQVLYSIYSEMHSHPHHVSISLKSGCVYMVPSHHHWLDAPDTLLPLPVIMQMWTWQLCFMYIVGNANVQVNST